MRQNAKRICKWWTLEEVEILKKKYPTQASNIPERDRTCGAIFAKAISLDFKEFMMVRKFNILNNNMERIINKYELIDALSRPYYSDEKSE